MGASAAFRSITSPLMRRPLSLRWRAQAVALALYTATVLASQRECCGKPSSSKMPHNRMELIYFGLCLSRTFRGRAAKTAAGARSAASSAHVPGSTSLDKYSASCLARDSRPPSFAIFHQDMGSFTQHGCVRRKVTLHCQSARHATMRAPLRGVGVLGPCSLSCSTCRLSRLVTGKGDAARGYQSEELAGPPSEKMVP